MSQPTTKELLRDTQVKGVAVTNAPSARRDAAIHDMTIAKMRYRMARFIEDLPASVVFTQEDADSVCAVINARVAK